MKAVHRGGYRRLSARGQMAGQNHDQPQAVLSRHIRHQEGSCGRIQVRRPAPSWASVTEPNLSTRGLEQIAVKARRRIVGERIRLIIEDQSAVILAVFIAPAHFSISLIARPCN